MAYVGILYDDLAEVIVDRCPVERETEEDAQADAEALAKAADLGPEWAYVYDQEFNAIIFN